MERIIEKQVIQSSLAQFIASNILNNPERNIDGSARLISGGLLDSFSLMDLTLFIESEWNVRLENTELNQEAFDNLDDLSNLILQKLQK